MAKRAFQGIATSWQLMEWGQAESNRQAHLMGMIHRITEVFRPANVDKGRCCWHHDNMPAELKAKERIRISDTAFVDVVIWRVPEPLAGSQHGFKYRLACVVNEQCVLRYDNEAGKGDHKHLHQREVPYLFTTLDQLVMDFWADVARMGDGDD